MSGAVVPPSKRCPRCGALAGMDAPICATCGRSFRGTIGQGAPSGPPPVAGPPPPLGALPSGHEDSRDGPESEDASAGTRISLLLIAAFVVGTVLLAIVASMLERRGLERRGIHNEARSPIVLPSVLGSA